MSASTYTSSHFIPMLGNIDIFVEKISENKVSPVPKIHISDTAFEIETHMNWGGRPDLTRPSLWFHLWLSNLAQLRKEILSLCFLPSLADSLSCWLLHYISAFVINTSALSFDSVEELIKIKSSGKSGLLPSSSPLLFWNPSSKHHLLSSPSPAGVFPSFLPLPPSIITHLNRHQSLSAVVEHFSQIFTTFFSQFSNICHNPHFYWSLIV